MTESDITAIARRQLADYDAHRPGRLFEDASFRLTVEEAYAVQMQTAVMRSARGEAIAGYKIGCVSKPVQRQLDLDRPVFGHLFATELYRSGVELKPMFSSVWRSKASLASGSPRIFPMSLGSWNVRSGRSPRCSW